MIDIILFAFLIAHRKNRLKIQSALLFQPSALTKTYDNFLQALKIRNDVCVSRKLLSIELFGETAVVHQNKSSKTQYTERNHLQSNLPLRFSCPAFQRNQAETACIS